MNNYSNQLLSEITKTAHDHGTLLIGTTLIRRTEPVILLAFPYTNTWFFNHPFSLTARLAKEYQESKYTQDQIAKMIRQEGYRAEYKTVLSVFGDFRPLAVAAGLGQWGRNGLVVTKDYGSGVLFSAIFTNAPLEVSEPLAPELLAKTPHSNCSSCNHCIEACPAKAFTEEGFNYRRCLPYSLRGCSECIKSCGK